MVKVELQELNRIFGDGTRVGPIDLTIEDGELLTLLGPSGSGKTTTLRIVAGFIRPDKGAVIFDGEDVASVPPKERSIGMVFQSIALFPHMTVYQNIAFGPEMAGWSHEDTVQRVEELAELLRIKNLLFRKINEISGGEGQRVALARALALNPRLLLLDEPLSALDPQLRERLQIEIRKIQKKLGITTIYVTHSQDEAFAISDRIAILDDGVIVQVGSPEDLYENPQNEFVARFLGGGNVFEGLISEISGNNQFVIVNDHPFRIQSQFQDSSMISFSVKPQDIIVHHNVSGDYASAELISITPQIGNWKLILDFQGITIVAFTSEDELIVKLRHLIGSRIGFNFNPEDAVILEST